MSTDGTAQLKSIARFVNSPVVDKWRPQVATTGAKKSNVRREG